VRTLIVGAGIGGLAAAAGLRRDGHDVVLLERNDAVTGLGAGISLWPNAIHALGRLGLRDAVEAVGSPVSSGSIRTWRGDVLLPDEVATFEARFGAPLVVVHRRDLHAALLSSLGDVVLRTGAEVVGVDQDDSGVRVALADGGFEEGDLVVGADGIRSSVRAAVLADGPPRYSGATAWRCVVPLDAGLLARTRDGEYWGRGRLFGIVRLSDESAYCFAAARAPEGERRSPDEEKADLLAGVDGWADPIPELVAATPAEEILRHDLYDRPAKGPWGKKRVTTLGDAAHPMLPNLGQGACQAIEDAAALAAALKPGQPRPDDAIPVETDLRAYESARMARAHMVVRQSRQACRAALARGAIAEGARNLVLRSLPKRSRDRQAAKIIGG
jgi:2-polyprenyl-6-methoxyphenol hydroxylase-like FAD-dependent oxidoreductase